MAKKDKLVLTEGQMGLTSKMTGSQLGAKTAALGVASSQTAAAYSPQFNGERVEVNDMIAEVSEVALAVAKNKMAGVETMLVSQMIALDAMFNNLAQRAYKAEYMNNLETYTKLALKAQAQARCTAEALAMMKNPQPYIKQANIAQGHQQVNNTYASASSHTSKVVKSSPAEKTETAQSKLLGENNARMDTRTQSQTSGTNQGMEALGTQHRSKDTRR